EGPHLEASADQERDFVQAFTAPLQLFDVIADGARFLIAIPATPPSDELAFVDLAPKRLAETTLVLGDQARSSPKDMRHTTVVLLETTDPGAGKSLLKAQDVADLGTAPAVDRLVVITNTTDIPPPLAEQSQPEILGNIGVLILIDQHIFEPPLIIGEHIGIVLEEAQAFKQEIPEIAGVEQLEPLLIQPIEFAPLAAK